MTRKILKLAEVAERTGLPLSTHRWYRQKGIGPATFRLGRHVVAYEDEVEEWINQQRAAQGAA